MWACNIGLLQQYGKDYLTGAKPYGTGAHLLQLVPVLLGCSLHSGATVTGVTG